jgi:hypothetical protein
MHNEMQSMSSKIRKKLNRIHGTAEITVSNDGNCTFFYSGLQEQIQEVRMLVYVDEEKIAFDSTRNEGADVQMKYGFLPNTQLMTLDIEISGKKLIYESDGLEQYQSGRMACVIQMETEDAVYLVYYCSSVEESVADLVIKGIDPREQKNSLKMLGTIMFHIMEMAEGSASNER